MAAQGVCGRSLAETAVSNPARGMDVYLLRVLSGRDLSNGLIIRPETPTVCVRGNERDQVQEKTSTSITSRQKEVIRRRNEIHSISTACSMLFLACG